MSERNKSKKSGSPERMKKTNVGRILDFAYDAIDAVGQVSDDGKYRRATLYVAGHGDGSDSTPLKITIPEGYMRDECEWKAGMLFGDGGLGSADTVHVLIGKDGEVYATGYDQPQQGPEDQIRELLQYQDRQQYRQHIRQGLQRSKMTPQEIAGLSAELDRIVETMTEDIPV
jgi:hypothetical protein